MSVITCANQPYFTEGARLLHFTLSASITDVHALGLETASGMLLTEGFYWDFDARTRAWSSRFI